MTKITVHRKAKVSTVKSRKEMQRPAVKRPIITRFQDNPIQEVPVQVASSKPAPEPESAKIQPEKTFDMVKVNSRMQKRAKQRMQTAPAQTKTAQEIKEAEIAKAILAADQPFLQKRLTAKRHQKTGFGFRRVILAIACTAVVVFSIVYFVNISSPDISLKVAAMQVGIDAHYPEYIPRGFSLSDVTSENGKITLNFKNTETGDAFSLIEEKTSWSPRDLYSEFVLPKYGNNYTVISENGFNIYNSDGDATWVNDGILYKIVTKSGLLTKKQISTIAAKL